MQKTVLITGATSGIGYSCAELFAKEKWRVICLGRDRRKLEEIVALVQQRGTESLGFEVDLSKLDESKAFFEQNGDQVGVIDALINSAGVAPKAKIEETSDADWEDTFRVNVTAAFGMIREALPYMRKSEAPSVVNISLIAGRLRSISLSCGYSTSKAAMIGMTRHLAGELGPDGFRVNCICPSQTKTPMLDDALSQEGKKALAQSIPLRRLAQPEEQAAVIHFLCSPAASYMNGAIIDVNGGVL